MLVSPSPSPPGSRVSSPQSLRLAMKRSIEKRRSASPVARSSPQGKTLRRRKVHAQVAASGTSPVGDLLSSPMDKSLRQRKYIAGMNAAVHLSPTTEAEQRLAGAIEKSIVPELDNSADDIQAGIPFDGRSPRAVILVVLGAMRCCVGSVPHARNASGMERPKSADISDDANHPSPAGDIMSSPMGKALWEAQAALAQK